jgi:acyl-CoA synthetase (AMP-forming)/AMP-acid ligase II
VHVLRNAWLLNDPVKTKEAIDTAGWMHSGDLATMDEEGYINIVGRIKDMIIRGGENIYPKVIEEFLYTHKKIKEVSVLEFQMKSKNKSVFGFKCMTNQN